MKLLLEINNLKPVKQDSRSFTHFTTTISDIVSEDRNESRRYRTPRKTENNAAIGEEPDDDTCPLNCKTKHHLAACPVFQELAISQRWEIGKQHWRCRKCLRRHHTRNCRKADASTCDKCRKNHHRSLHNDKIGETSSNPSPRASPFQSQCQASSSTSIVISKKMLFITKRS